ALPHTCGSCGASCPPLALLPRHGDVRQAGACCSYGRHVHTRVQGRALAHPVGQYRTPPRTCERTVVAGHHTCPLLPSAAPPHKGERRTESPAPSTAVGAGHLTTTP